jgi:predicted TIM-barrel fold metal-dependent hydrolase
MALDLTGLPIVDHHCHPLLPDPWNLGAEQFLGLFTESDDRAMLRGHVLNTAWFRRALRDMAAVLRCAPTPGAVLDARRNVDRIRYTSKLLSEERIEALVMDLAFPPGAPSIGDLRTALPVQVEWVCRIEAALERHLASVEAFPDLVEAFRRDLEAADKGGAVAYKTIVAYRSGLAIRQPTESEARTAFSPVRESVRRGGKLRLTDKTLLDFFVHRTLERAAIRGTPVQFHTGFGDADLDLLQSNPLLLRPILMERRYAGVPVVLLHAAYPYVREASYLAGLHGNVFLDLSLAVPLVGPSMVGVIQEALSLAPWSKVLYASDLSGIPELYWLGARHGRWALGRLVSGLVSAGFLTEEEALTAARAILAGNAARLYGIRLDDAA